MAGGTGSGKTSVIKHLNLAKEAVDIDNDDVLMTLFPQEDPLKVYDCMAEMIPIMVDLTARALQAKVNIVKDGTGQNSKRYIALAEKMKEGGYETEMVAVYIPVDVALTRVALRAKHEGRDVPAATVERLHRRVAEALPIYSKSDAIDSLSIYDNNVARGSPAILIFSRGSEGAVKCKDEVKTGSLLEGVATLCGRG